MVFHSRRDPVPNREYVTTTMYRDGKEIAFVKVLLTNPHIAIFTRLFIEYENYSDEICNQLKEAAIKEIGPKFELNFSHFEIQIHK